MGNVNFGRAFATLQGTVSTTALSLVTFGFTQAQVDEAGYAEIFVNTQSIRINYGTNPTTSNGGILNSTLNRHDEHVYGNDNIQALRMIRNGANDSEVFIVLYD